MSDQPERFIVTDRRRVDAGAPPPGAGDPSFADIVDRLCAEYKAAERTARSPMLPPEVEQAIRAGEARATELLRSATGRDDEHAPIDSTVEQHLAACVPCAQADDTIGPIEAVEVPFGSEADRDRWATTHAEHHTHSVALIRRRYAGDRVESEIVGYAEPPLTAGEQQAAREAAAGRATAGRPPAPLVAFVVAEGRDPDLMCRVPHRAGAAWLLYAAHAVLLGAGRGSAGIPTPHRVMYSGRVSRTGGAFEVRIDGMIGATAPGWGAPVGTVWGVHGNATPADVEDAVEALLADEYGLDRHAFSVICCADATLPDPPDPAADAFLRARRRVDPDRFAAEREQRPPTREPNCPPACSEMHTFGPGCLLHVRYEQLPADVLDDEAEAAAGGPDPDYGRDLDDE